MVAPPLASPKALRRRVGGAISERRSCAPARHSQCVVGRPSVGGDSLRLFLRRQLAVSIYAPARGATRSSSATEPNSAFQSTPPRGGRRIPLPAIQSRRVSIHAPARGATNIQPQPRFKLVFQSTPPRGGRPIQFFSPDSHANVSIHAPARGATCVVGFAIALSYSFNPRPRAGGDVGAQRRRRFGRFQSTPPRGGRRAAWNAEARPSCFNPRPLDHRSEKPGVFQSTPPRGGRPSRCLLSWASARFNPRPRAGGDSAAVTCVCS